MLRRRVPDIYEGWIVVGASAFTVLLVASSFFFGFGTIFNEVVAEFGWSVGATSLAFSLRTLLGGAVSPFIGALVDWRGPRPVLLTGIVVTGAGVLAMSFIQGLWQFYAAMLVVAVGTAAAGGTASLAAIATWFRDRRARAMSLMTLGGGMGGVVVFGIATLVDAFGWRWALRALALAMLTLGFAAGTRIRSRPPDHAQPLDGIRPRDWRAGDPPAAHHEWGVPVREAVLTRTFILLTLALTLNNFGTTAFVVHQVPYLERALGVRKEVAGATVAVFTLTSIVGRLGFGFLADRYPKRLIMAASISLVAIGLPLLALATTLWQAIAAIMVVAPGFGGTIPVRPAIVADYFGTKTFGTINGVQALMTTIGGAIGPWVVGVIVDRTGGYDLGWWLSAGIVALAIPPLLLATAPDALIARYRPGGAPRVEVTPGVRP